MKRIANWFVPMAAAVLAMAAAAWAGDSAPMVLDTRDGTRIASEGVAERIAISGRWNGAAATITADGAVFATAEAGEDKTVEWTPVGTGLHVLQHRSGGETLEAAFTVLGDDVALHAGAVAGSETWAAGKVHLVTATVTVESGAALTIESGAVVKFMYGTGLAVASGGSCTAYGVVFTHVADDTVGGDTMGDGNGTQPIMGAYSLSGNILEDEATEERYAAPVVLGGTLSYDTRLQGHKVYTAIGNITIASGVTVTIAPGAIIKMGSGLSVTVASGATLVAQGTRAEPIVCTSVKDDEHGGDSNGDGDATSPQPGDWYQIRVQGTAIMDHCSVLYASSTENYGGVEAYGGTVEFYNGEIAFMKYDSVNAHSSGTFTAHNSVIREGSLGLGYYGSGRVKAFNCVFHGLTTAVRQSGKELVNCVFSECQSFTDQGGDGSTFRNCVFWNPAGYGAQSYTKVGSNGNVWANPLFVDGDNGDFRVRAGSACIDAGDGTVAPETDYFGRPRMNDPNVADTGVTNGSGVCPDIGIYEMEGGNAASDVDLEAVRVSAPSVALVGGELAVEWTVANVGTEKAAGPWRDVVSLVNEATGETAELGEAVSAGGLAGKASKGCSGRFTVPAVSEGEWRVKVQANAYRDVYEGGAVTNNAALSAGTVRIAVPGLDEDGTASGTAGAGVPWTTKVAVPEDGRWMLRVEAGKGSVVRYGVGFVPGEGNASGKATVGADGTALVSLAAGTTVYVMVEGKGAVNVRLVDAALAVGGVSPAELPGSGTTTLTVKGANFEQGAAVSVGGVAATATEWLNAETLVATVDCASLPSGVCTVEVAQGEESASLPAAVTVKREAGKADLKAWLEVPSSVRQGRVVTLYVNYENVGNLDMPAPVLGLTATGLVFRVGGNEFTNRVNLLGLGEEAPVGTLRPGEKQRVAVEAVVAGSANSVRYALTSRWSGSKGAEEEIRAGQFLDAAWAWRQGKEAEGAAKVEALRDAVGRTWGDFYERLGTFVSGTREENAGATVYEEVASEYVESVYWSVCAPEPGGIGELDDTDDGSGEDVENWGDEDDETGGEHSGTNMERPTKSGTARTAEVTVLTHPSGLFRPGTLGDFEKDNAIDGDVWCWTGSTWALLFSDQKNVKINGITMRRTGLVEKPGGESSNTTVFQPGRATVLICHGMQNSIQQQWVTDMAVALYAKHRHSRNILAVDWGNGADSKWPWKTSMAIDDTAVPVFHNLRDAGVTASSLTLIGHSHGAHLAGRLATKLHNARLGKVARLIGLDVSTADAGVHWHDGVNYWKKAEAKQKLFYKSSWTMSISHWSSNDLDADFNFVLVPDNDFYYLPVLALEHETKRHSYSCDWFISTIKKNSKFNWGYNFEATQGNCSQWKERTTMDKHPGRNVFAGVINGTHQVLELAGRPDNGAGTAKDDWTFEGHLHNPGAKKMDSMHEYTLREVDYAAVELQALATTEKGNESGVLVTGGKAGNTVNLTYKNRANNTSIPWDDLGGFKALLNMGNAAYLPWCGKNYLENSLWLARVSDIDGGTSVLSALHAGKPLSKVQLEAVRKVSCKIARSEGTEDNFARPGGWNLRQTFSGVMVPPELCGTHRLGCDENNKPLEDGEACVLLGLAGENNESGQVYKYDLASQTNNFVALPVTVYDGELGIPVIHKSFGRGRATARAGDDDWLSEVAVDVDATKEGAWSVTLDGSKSIFPHGSEALYWWFNTDLQVVSRKATATFRGVLPEDADYDEVTVWLAVSDAEDAKLAECTLRITRQLPEPEEEAEDGKGSNVPISCDPNEMGGPDGVKMVEEGGTNRYVQAGREMEYSIYFENKADAAAAAQEVRVVNPLSEWLDWDSFEMEEVVFRNQVDLGLAGKASGTSEAALEGNEPGWKVKTTLAVSTNGVAEWYLRVVDESTADGWPVDPYAGFLPPNDAAGNGEGRLTYRVKVRDDAPIGAVIRNSAVITFDYNAPIETDPAWWNIVEAVTNVVLDGVSAEGARDGNGTVEVVAGKPYGDLLPVPTRLGWSFEGWFTGPDGTGNQVTAETVASADTLELFAKWVRAMIDELWLDVTHGSVVVGTNGVTAGFAPDGNAVEGLAECYVLTGTSSVHSVRFAGGSFTNTWTNLVVDLGAKDAVGVLLEGASLDVTLAGDNFIASGEDCAGIRVDTNSVLTLHGDGRLEAYGGKCGAGIGGGKLQESGRVEIRSGTLEAYGGEYGAGIGGGLVAPAAGVVVITGGSVKARGSDGGEDIGGGFGREGTGVPVDGEGIEVHEVEVPFATDTLPVTVAVDLGGGRTYQYTGMGHEGDTSLWFWLPDGTYEFEADGDDYGAHVAGAKVAAVFTDPGAEHFEAPAAEVVESLATGWRVGLNPAFRTTPFVLWTATGLDGHDWAWVKLTEGVDYVQDPSTGRVEYNGAQTMGLRVFKFEFLQKE